MGPGIFGKRGKKEEERQKQLAFFEKKEKIIWTQIEKHTEEHNDLCVKRNKAERELEEIRKKLRENPNFEEAIRNVYPAIKKKEDEIKEIKDKLSKLEEKGSKLYRAQSNVYKKIRELKEAL